MEKIKQFINQILESEKGKDILIVIIVILVGLGSFELGRLSKENNSTGLKIDYTDQNRGQNTQIIDQEANVILGPNSIKTPNSTISKITQNSDFVNKNFFASSSGSKYYSISCSAGKTIKQENRIYFSTGEEAQLAGYMLSSACQ